MATEVERLMVKIDADLSGMQTQLAKAVKNIETQKRKMEQGLTGLGFGAAAEKGFHNLAEAAGEASKSLPGIGSALGALGPAGLAAAAGVAAFVETMHETQEAVEWAANIEKTAKLMGISTDFLQEFNFAARQSEVDVGAADTALQGLSNTFQAIRGGITRNKLAVKSLAEIFGIDIKDVPAFLSSFKSIDEFFPVLQKHLQALGDSARSTQLAKSLKMEDLAPMFEKTAKPIDDLIAKMKQLNILVPEALIDKAADAKVQLATLADVTKAKTNVTFLEFLDTLIKIKGAFADVQVAFLTLASVLTGTTPLEKKIEILKGHIAQEQKAKDTFGFNPFLDDDQEKLYGEQRQLARNQRAEAATAAANAKTLAAQQKAAADKQEADRKRIEAEAAAAAKKAARGDPRVITAEAGKAAEDAYQSSLKELADAQAGLATTVEDRAADEKAASQAGSDKKIADLKAKQVEITGKELDTDKVNQNKRIDAAISNERIAEYLRKDLIDQQTLNALLDERIQQEQAQVQLAADALSAQADHETALSTLAATDKERAAHARAALTLQQQRDDLLAANTLKAANERLGEAWISGDSSRMAGALSDVAAAQQAVDQQAQKNADARSTLNQSLESPVQKYQRDLQNLNTTMEDDGVQAIKSLSDGLADAIVNAKNLGDVVSSVFRQLLTQLLSAELQRTIVNPLLDVLKAAVPGVGTANTMSAAQVHLAGGTLSSFAGLTMVGEKGPELVSLPGGSQVIPNSALRNIGMGSRQAGSTVITFDNRGAMIWEEAAKQMMSYADRVAMIGSAGAIEAARRSTPTDLSRVAGRRLS